MTTDTGYSSNHRKEGEKQEEMVAKNCSQLRHNISQTLFKGDKNPSSSLVFT